MISNKQIHNEILIDLDVIDICENNGEKCPLEDIDELITAKGDGREDSNGHATAVNEKLKTEMLLFNLDSDRK